MKKIIALLIAAVLVLAGCSSSEEQDTGSITISVEPTYVEYFTAAGEAFTAETGVEVEVMEAPMFETLEALPTQKENAPDLIMAPNDKIGTLAQQKLIAPVEADLTGYTENAQAAVTYEGAQYSLPLSTETLVFIYNKDLMSEVPATLEEMDPSTWAADFVQPYTAAGLFYNMGGYVFGEDYTDVGIANEGSIEAGQIISDLYNSGSETWELMKDSTVSYTVMMEAFKSGTISAMINGPWTFSELDAAGVNYGVAPVPSWNEEGTFQPFASVKGLVINAYTDNMEACQQFIEFIATPEWAQKYVEATNEVSPHTSVIYEEGSNAKVVFDAAAAGTPLPNAPEMGLVWTPWSDAMKQIASGADPKESLEAAVVLINDAIAAQ